MKIERLLLIAALVAVLLAIAPWLYTFSTTPVSGEPSDWSYFGSYVGGILSPVLAFASFVGLLMTLTQQRAAIAVQRAADDDKNYFNHAVSSLERAYDVISAGDQSTGPVRERLAWLTCARLLLSAKDVSALISDQSKGLRALFAGEEEHWRYCFYELFQRVNPPVGRNPTFFSCPTNPQRDEIDERSIRVVFDFVNWPEGKEDSIACVPRYTEEELNAMGLLMSGVREYLLPAVERRARRDDA